MDVYIFLNIKQKMNTETHARETHEMEAQHVYCFNRERVKEDMPIRLSLSIE